MFHNADRLHDPFRLRPHKIDREQPVLEVGTEYLHTFRQHEGALELTRRDASVEVLAGPVIVLASADLELIFLNRHVELIARETGDRERDTQAFGEAVFGRNPLDVVGRISVRTLGDAVEHALDLIEAEEERTG